MMDPHDHEACRRLLASLDRLAVDDADEVERIIAEHLDACPICAAEEGRLGELIATYSRTVTSLPPGLEARLLDRLCPRD
jgi:hypothetical protein